MSKHDVEMTINGRRHAGSVEARVSLSDFLRGDAGYTGVHVGCEHGVCGACTVIVDGQAVRSCLMLAVQADGAEVTTAEGLAAPDGTLHPVQQVMLDEFALQCGFCTPGVVMTFAALTQGDAKPSEQQLLGAMSGHVCRCTGYQGIRRAAKRLACTETPACITKTGEPS
jgi:carbon-monoxide dehydrogenase small subunit